MGIRFAFVMSLVAVGACSGGEVETPKPEPVPAPVVVAPVPAPPVVPAVVPVAPVPAGAKVMFVSPADGAKVKSPVKLVFGVEGMKVQPAGQAVEGTGHHHVIIGASGTPTGEVVPADETHIHFGKGQTEAELPLPAGEHKLTLQFADGIHASYGPALSQTITIVVE